MPFVLEGTPILVSAALGRDLVGVRRAADDSLWLAQWSEDQSRRVSGVALCGLEPGKFHDEGWAAVGGVLPEGARTAAVLDRTGTWRPASVANAAWAAIIVDDLSEVLRRDWDRADQTFLERFAVPPFVFRDSGGDRVSVRSRAEVRASRRVPFWERRTRAHFGMRLGGPCPVCSEHKWRAIAVPRETGVGEHIFCARCGYSDYLVAEREARALSGQTYGTVDA